MPTADPIDRICQANAGRVPALLRRKFDAMAADPFVFLRATARISHEAVDLSALPKAPRAWVSGDLHLQNFGSFRGENRLVYFDLNDFDEAALLPACVDLIRLVASLLCAAPGVGIDEREARRLAVLAIDAHGAALERGKPFWLERSTAEGPIRELLRRTDERKRVDLLAPRTTLQGRRRILRIDGQRYLAVPADHPIRAAISGALELLAQAYPDAPGLRLRDIAFRVAGMGSLGVQRYVALVRGRGDPDRNLLIDFKQAVPSAAAMAHPRARQPRWDNEAQRVIQVQSWCQAASPALLSVVPILGVPYIARELQPVEDRIAIERLRSHRRRLETTLAEMARLSAWAQLRAASRRGADGAEQLQGWGTEVRARHRDLLAAARHVGAENLRAHRRFQKAWKAGDPRLARLAGGPGQDGS